MRTTLIIDDHLLKEAKRQAIQSGLSLSELMSMALRDLLRDRRHPPTSRSLFSMPTYGSGDKKRTSSAGEIAALRDEGR